MRERKIVGDSIVTVETTVTVEPRVIDYHDIETHIDYDEWFHDAPWDNCDGWEHEFVPAHWSDNEDKRDHYSFVNRYACDGGNGYIVIDDDTIINGWGFTRPDGMAKQPYREWIARIKRKATATLVKWYEDGWQYYVARAKYGDYSDSCGGIDCEDYAEEVAEECRAEVAAQLEEAGYTVTNKPEPVKQQSRADRMRERIRHNLYGAFE